MCEVLFALHHHNGMQKRGADQPWHERDVLNRIPHPPTAPAEFIIGPDGPHCDAECEKAPRQERPRFQGLGPSRAYFAGNQGSNSHRKGQRVANIAHI